MVVSNLRFSGTGYNCATSVSCDMSILVLSVVVELGRLKLTLQLLASLNHPGRWIWDRSGSSHFIVIAQGAASDNGVTAREAKQSVEVEVVE